MNETVQQLEQPRPGSTMRLLVTSAAACALVSLGVAVIGFDWGALSRSDVAGILVLAGCAILAEAFPVPVRSASAGGISLAAIFIVGSAVLFGWGPAVLTGLVVRGGIEAAQRRPPVRVAYNSALHTLSALAAGAVASLGADAVGVGARATVILGSMAAFYVVNVGLVAAVVACAERQRFPLTFPAAIASTALPFVIMASVTLTLESLWERSPALIAALAGPLVAVALYQRAAHRELEAMRLAQTDPLTGLGNSRRFQERLEAACAVAAEEGERIALCVVDMDDLKAVNDRYGHPVGDRALVEIANQLRRAGEAFRLGGDEFALLLHGRGETEAVALAEKVVTRIQASPCEQVVGVGVSCGVTVLAGPEVEAAAAIDMADTALYWAKAQGKGRVCAYGPGLVALADDARAAFTADRAGQLQAATMLAHAVEARDPSCSGHSLAVGDLAARLASRLGLGAEQAELIGIAGRLHDVGKLVLPEELLRKADALTTEERKVVEAHPAIAFRLLDSIGMPLPIASWVLHHHEHWDGSGYPDRLVRTDIPLASRILLVADAYDAMTSERAYRRRTMSTEEALAELVRCTGSQFDPGVVSALLEELTASAGMPRDRGREERTIALVTAAS